jgi:hypothetical protein
LKGILVSATTKNIAIETFKTTNILSNLLFYLNCFRNWPKIIDNVLDLISGLEDLEELGFGLDLNLKYKKLDEEQINRLDLTLG